MTSPASLYTICYGAESSYGETTTTATTLQLQIADVVDTSGLVQNKIDPNPPKGRLMDGVQWILGTQEGTIKTKLWLTGHGSTTSGSTTAGLHETLIGKFVLGSAGAVVAAAASGTTATGGTAATWTTTASGTITQGAPLRLGAFGDARGGGQFYVGTHATTNYTPLNQPPGAPSNNDVIYSSITGYVPSTTTSMSSVRLLCQSKGLQYLCHGCVPVGDVEWGGLNVGEVPYIVVTWAVAWWEYSSATFPSSVTTEVFTPTVVAGNTFWCNDVGTATNTSGAAYRTIRNFSISHKLGTIQLPGTGGVNQYQKYVGAIRGPDSIQVSWVEDADDTTTSPVLPGYATGTTAKHVMYTLNANAGKAMGFYFPNLVISDKVPVQYNDGGINRFKITAMAYTGPTTTTELTASAMRVAWA